MVDRWPVWLTEEELHVAVDALGLLIDDDAEPDDVRQEATGARESLTADPEPWLTVDDEGRVWRLERLRVAGTPEAGIVELPGFPVYRLVPVDEPGEG